MALLKMADRFSITRVEAACARALSYTPHPSYKNIITILKSGQDKLQNPATADPLPNPDSDDHGFTRGADYYKEEPEC